MKQLTASYIKNFSKLSLDKVKYLTENYNIPEWIIREYQNKFNWNLISRYQMLSEDFIREFVNRVNWNWISGKQKLSEDFIREFADRIDWFSISRNQKLSEVFIKKFKDEINWYYISQYQKLSEGFIREYVELVDWDLISTYQKLSEDFIREFSKNVEWNLVSTFQKLSEDFIREFAECVDWGWISRYQKLSEDFIREFVERVDLDCISRYQDISDEFRKEFNLEKPKNNWRYISTDEKLKKIKSCNKYEIQDNEFLIAYKGIRNDGYSKFNFQYHYEVNKTYECHADWNAKEENSFGLSAWTLKEAREYCDERIIKVKIHIDDIAALIHDSNKIRCQKFEVLEIVEEN